MVFQWINWMMRCGASISLVMVVTGCTSSLDKVIDENAPTMKEVYKHYIGADDAAMVARKTELMKRPAVHESDLQLDHPPYPERLDHLYPRLPNPDLFMYVRPHAVGVTGAPIPAYITRFSMYERQPYALPGETLESAKIMNDFRREQLAEQAKASATRNAPQRKTRN